MFHDFNLSLIVLWCSILTNTMPLSAQSNKYYLVFNYGRIIKLFF